MTGLIPVRRGSGTPYAASVSRYFVSGSDSTALFIGDPVAIDGTNTESQGHYPTVTKATLSANNQWVGAVVGVQVLSAEQPSVAPNLENKHRPASTAMYVFVSDDPDQEYWIGEDEAAAAIVTGDIGNLGIAVAGSGGSTVTGRSSVVLDSSSFDSGTATGQLLLLGMVDRTDYSLGGDGQLFRVKINEAMHQLATPGTSV